MTAAEPEPATVVGTVGSLHRFPVKSTAGESLAAAEVDGRGLRSDREWAVYTADGGIASGKTTRRFRRLDGLLLWRSSATADGAVPLLHSPDGATYPAGNAAAGAALTEAFGRPLRLAPESTVRHHDESPVHVVTTASVRAAEELSGGPLDPRRLRANIVLDVPGTAFAEDTWTGAQLHIGPAVVLALGPGMPRCVMVDRAQAEVPVGSRILTALGSRGTLLGLQAHVLRPGTVRVGDPVRITGVG